MTAAANGTAAVEDEPGEALRSRRGPAEAVRQGRRVRVEPEAQDGADRGRTRGEALEVRTVGRCDAGAHPPRRRRRRRSRRGRRGRRSSRRPRSRSAGSVGGGVGQLRRRDEPARLGRGVEPRDLGQRDRLARRSSCRADPRGVAIWRSTICPSRWRNAIASPVGDHDRRERASVVGDPQELGARRPVEDHDVGPEAVGLGRGDVLAVGRRRRGR